MKTNTNILLETGTNELEVVEFLIKFANKSGQLIDQSYGINVAKVREIIRMPKLTSMPNMKNSVYGVFNLRGVIIPALDLSMLLYNSKNSLADCKMIIAEFNKMQVGFIVNDVYRIHRISWTDILPPDTIGEFASGKSSIIGIIKLDERHILMLDVEKIVADINPASAIGTGGLKHKFENKPIVITAEDSMTIRKMITERLKQAGFEILAYNDGKSAWEKISEIKEKVKNGEHWSKYVNLVITDIEMPGMDGYTLTKFIKEEPALSGLPVIIFSSIVSTDVIHKGKSVGADYQLTKPQIGELLDTVRKIIA